MLIIIFINAFFGIIVGVVISMIMDTLLYDFIDIFRETRMKYKRLKAILISFKSFLKMTKKIFFLETDGFKASKQVLIAMRECSTTVFTSFKPIIGLSGFTFLIGAFYINCLTKYYDINDFINIGFTDYILYFFRLLIMYTPSKKSFVLPIIVLFAYLCMGIYYLLLLI